MKFVTFIVRVIIGFIFGWVFAIIGREIIGTFVGNPLFVFWFILSFLLLSFLKLSRTWSLTDVLVFNTIFFVTGYLIKTYITTAA